MVLKIFFRNIGYRHISLRFAHGSRTVPKNHVKRFIQHNPMHVLKLLILVFCALTLKYISFSIETIK